MSQARESEGEGAALCCLPLCSAAGWPCFPCCSVYAQVLLAGRDGTLSATPLPLHTTHL